MQTPKAGTPLISGDGNDTKGDGGGPLGGGGGMPRNFKELEEGSPAAADGGGAAEQPGGTPRRQWSETTRKILRRFGSNPLKMLACAFGHKVGIDPETAELGGQVHLDLINFTPALVDPRLEAWCNVGLFYAGVVSEALLVGLEAKLAKKAEEAARDGNA